VGLAIPRSAGLDPLWIRNLAQVSAEVQRASRPPPEAGKSGKVLAIPQWLALFWRVGYALQGKEHEENSTTNEQSTSPFLDTVHDAIRVRHYSIRSEDACVQWIKRYILFHGKRHPKDMGEVEVGAFLSHLATNRNVASSTQNQALDALVFLYKVVLERPLEGIGGVVPGKPLSGCRSCWPSRRSLWCWPP